MNKLILTLSERKNELLSGIIEHIQISFIALIIALIIAIPLGIYLSYHKKLANIVIAINGVIQTIPSLAILALLIPLVGIGRKPAIIALILYALLPILHNTYTGITGVDPMYMVTSRALAADPKIILMDEPFSALDPITRASLQEDVKKLQKQIHKTIVFVTHDIEEAFLLGDKICIIQDGELIQSGTKQEIISNPKNDFVKKFIAIKKKEGEAHE